MEKELLQVKSSHDSFKDVIDRMNGFGDALD
jgi:predicted CopG family antitoxin